MNNDRRGMDMQFLFGLFIGGLVGALIIFFLGTKEGKKVEKVIEDKGRGLADDLGDQLKQLEKKGQELVKQGEEIKEQVMETLEDKKEDMTESTTQKLDTALAHIEELQSQSLDTTAALRRRIFKNVPKKR